MAEFGTIDILVNNAQEVPLGPLAGVSDETFTAGWESGPLATFRLMKLCHPHLKGGGSIVNLGTAAAKRWDMANYGCYAAVKEAIRSLTRAAACEWSKTYETLPPPETCTGVAAESFLRRRSSGAASHARWIVNCSKSSTLL